MPSKPAAVSRLPRRHYTNQQSSLRQTTAARTRIVPNRTQFHEQSNDSLDEMHTNNVQTSSASSDSHNLGSITETVNEGSCPCPGPLNSSDRIASSNNQSTNMTGLYIGNQASNAKNETSEHKKNINEELQVPLENSQQYNVNSMQEEPGSESSLSTSSHTRHIQPLPPMPQVNPVAAGIASRLIKHARDIKYPNEKDMWCLQCGLFPILPVTGQCGHTRCTNCIELNKTCPCGVEAPAHLHVNVLIHDLMEKIINTDNAFRNLKLLNPTVNETEENLSFPSTSSSGPKVVKRCSERRRIACAPYSLKAAYVPNEACRMPMSAQTRFSYARQLISLGHFGEAAPHLAHVAASDDASLARSARTQLSQVITNLNVNFHWSRLIRDLYRAVRLTWGMSRPSASDLECVLCTQTFVRPVTTPCGHTYCRTCIERSLDYRNTCALCMRPLTHFKLSATADNTFITAALLSIDAVSTPNPPEPDIIFIIACNVAYPSTSCPLFIFDPRYRVMIRRVLQSESRVFGMIGKKRDRSLSDYGTALEVKDCVLLKDGRTILSTIGVYRFAIVEKCVRDGCDVARIRVMTDVTPENSSLVSELRIMAQCLFDKAQDWLSNLDEILVMDIETTLGKMPGIDCDEDWWESPDGPKWLWWIIAILPLRPEIQTLILSTKDLMKRMTAVSRTLEALRSQLTKSQTSAICALKVYRSNVNVY